MLITAESCSSDSMNLIFLNKYLFFLVSNCFYSFAIFLMLLFLIQSPFLFLLCKYFINFIFLKFPARFKAVRV